MNDSSSRSHCFVWLTLRRLDSATDDVRTSRFQFVDLAGSERLSEAHNISGGNAQKQGWDVLAGIGTNYSLTMLSQCARQLMTGV